MSETVPSQTLRDTASTPQDRLARWRRFVDAECLDRLRLTGDERVLDVGCGPATLAGDLGRVGRPPVVRLTRGDAIADAGPLVDERRADLHDLPLRAEEWGTFDVVHCAFTLSHETRPQQIVEQLARALRPGGRMILVDDDLDVVRMWPSMPAVDEIWRAYVRAIADRGNDPFIGRKLVAMLQLAELEPTRALSVQFGGCSGSDHWDCVITNLANRLVSAREEILASSAIPRDLFNEVLDSLHSWSQRAGATVWNPVCWTEAKKP